MSNLTTRNKYAKLYLQAAKKLGLSSEVIDPIGFIRLSSAHKTHFFYKAVTDINTAVSAALCRDKNITFQRLLAKHLSCPSQVLIESTHQLKSQLKPLTYPLVLKPYDGIAGQDVYTNIGDYQSVAGLAQELLSKHSSVVVENHVHGDDYRFLVLDQQVIGIIKKTIPSVTGDGNSTLQELIKRHPHANKIPLDNSLHQVINQAGFSLHSIIPTDHTLQIRPNANISTGGSVTTLNNSALHPEIVALAINAAHAVQTRLAGVDIILSDPTTPVKENAYVIEVNHNPGIWMHYHPDQGKIQPVAATILSTIFNL